MTQNDLRILCTALGFSIVITGDVPAGKQALRATTIARLIKSFCQTSVPEALADEHSRQVTPAAEAERLLERYIAELRDHGSARFDFDRNTLLEMYELLLTQKLRHSQKEFYDSAPDNVIANRVLQMADEKIQREEEGAKS